MRLEEKKGNKWFAVLMTAGALAVIALIVVIVMAVAGVSKQIDEAKKKADDAFVQAMHGAGQEQDDVPDGK